MGGNVFGGMNLNKTKRRPFQLISEVQHTPVLYGSFIFQYDTENMKLQTFLQLNSGTIIIKCCIVNEKGIKNTVIFLILGTALRC